MGMVGAVDCVSGFLPPPEVAVERTYLDRVDKQPIVNLGIHIVPPEAQWFTAVHLLAGRQIVVVLPPSTDVLGPFAEPDNAVPNFSSDVQVEFPKCVPHSSFRCARHFHLHLVLMQAEWLLVVGSQEQLLVGSTTSPTYPELV